MGRSSDGPRLPVLDGLWAQLARTDGPPTLDQARRTLGGPWLDDAAPEARALVGRLVRLRGREGEPPRRGVVLHASDADLDVWVGGGRVHRVERDRVDEETEADSGREGSDGGALEAVAADASVHASLGVGVRVVFQARDGATEKGMLAEKMRYGSLVGTDDGRIVAVSFRRIGPAAEGESS